MGQATNPGILLGGVNACEGKEVKEGDKAFSFLLEKFLWKRMSHTT